MKLIIQIPCYNEEFALPVSIAALPRNVQGFDETEWLIIDDGSTDKTAQIAKQLGVNHIIRMQKHKGLARGFMTGLDACLKLGADVIVNTDADNQYCADDIPALVKPILDGKAEMVIGCRPISNMKHFSPLKKLLQRMGSYVVKKVSGCNIPDAPSGFRAISRNAAMMLNVFNDYTYTLETIIQAGQKNMAITWVPVRVNRDLRPSRLVTSILRYVSRSLVTIIRIFAVYNPFKFFMLIGIFSFFTGFLIGFRFLIFLIMGDGIGHIQSLILTSVLLGFGFQTMLVAFVADLLAVNRKILEDIQIRERQRCSD